MNSAHQHPATRAGVRILAVIVTSALALIGVALAPSAQAAPATSTAVPAAGDRSPNVGVGADNTGPATLDWHIWEGGTRVGDARSVTFTVQGNRSVGKPAWIEMRKVNFETNTQELVRRVDLVMTAEPQVVELPVDTSKVDGYMYFLSYDYWDGACGSAGFSYTVMPAAVTPPPTDPTNPGESGGTDGTGSSGTNSITLSDTPAKVRVGARVRLVGTIGAASPAGLRVVAEAKTRKGWVKVGSARSVADGRYAVRTSALPAGARRLKVSVPKLSISATAPIRVRR